MKKSVLIYLNGTSSCGKSTIAKEIKKLIPTACRISADEFEEEFVQQIDKEDPEYKRITEKYAEIWRGVEKAFSEEERTQSFQALYDAMNEDPLPLSCNSDLQMYQKIVTLLPKESLIIVDDLIATDFLFQEFTRTFRDLPVTIYMVKVDCALPELERREQARGDRFPGMAAFWHKKAHEKRSYDLTIDTSKDDPTECARQVLTLIRMKGKG